MIHIIFQYIIRMDSIWWIWSGQESKEKNKRLPLRYWFAFREELFYYKFSIHHSLYYMFFCKNIHKNHIQLHSNNTCIYIKHFLNMSPWLDFLTPYSMGYVFYVGIVKILHKFLLVRAFIWRSYFILIIMNLSKFNVIVETKYWLPLLKHSVKYLK
jgi:hypothetical protein